MNEGCWINPLTHHLYVKIHTQLHVSAKLCCPHVAHKYTECPTRYGTLNFFNNSNTNEDIATKRTHTTNTFLFISHTTKVLLFKFRCNMLIGVRIIKEMPGSVASGSVYKNDYATLYIILLKWRSQVVTVAR
jgi:hypothetical protein